MPRLDGWETRLAAVVESARHQEYVLGVHDCFRVACAALEALTGVDRWAEWAGRYRTKREALRLLAEYAGGEAEPFTAAFTRFFGVDPSDARLARRGDIVEFHDGREPHLGVALATRAAVLTEHGLDFVPLAECRHCWRIG